MLRYAAWKSGLFFFVLLVSLFYGLPTWYGEDPALKIVSKKFDQPNAKRDSVLRAVEVTLSEKMIKIRSLDDLHQKGPEIGLRFWNTHDQMRAKDVLERTLFQEVDDLLALNLLPVAPPFFERLGARPVKLGLDLRGGVYFLLEADLKAVLKKRLQDSVGDLKQAFQGQFIRYRAFDLGSAWKFSFKDQPQKEQALAVLKEKFPMFNSSLKAEEESIEIDFHDSVVESIRHQVMEQIVLALRKRVNELGVAEALVQSQGAQKIVVELPGIQDTAYAKQMLGKTATLHFCLEADEKEASDFYNHGVVSPETQAIEYKKEGSPQHFKAPKILLKKEVLLTGDSIVHAYHAVSPEGRPEVHVQLMGQDASNFYHSTAANVGKRLAVVYQEWKQGHLFQKVISFATIDSALGNGFRISGLNVEEARDLALLLRSGNLPTSVSIVEEKVIGPALGQDNIHRGLLAAAVGIVLVAAFMFFYYGLLGLMANVGLFCNFSLLLALLASLDATITLPGIAGIVLTLGMAVDANVLIFERIREELKKKSSPLLALQRGFEGAWAAILDSNITTLISGLVLFLFGSGPVKGFAVTLSLGILTSLFTAVLGCRVLVQLYYGQKKVIGSISVGV